MSVTYPAGSYPTSLTKRDQIDRVTLWGIHDGMSWKNNYPIPNRTNYTLLWNRALQPKPALGAVLEVPAQAK